MNQRKTILIVTTRFPWPLDDGFANKNYYLIKGLSCKYEIDLCVIQDGDVTKESLNKITPFCRSIEIFKPSILEKVIGFLRAICFCTPFQMALFYSQKAMQYVENKRKFADVSICSVIRSAQYFPLSSESVIYDLADNLGEIYIRDSIKFHGIKRWMYYTDGIRIKKYQDSLVKARVPIFLFNKEEVKKLNSKNVSVAPHGVNPVLFESIKPSDEIKDGVVFFGRMNVETNLRSVIWFINNILVALPPSIKLYIIGAKPTQELLLLSKENKRIEVLGFIDNPYPMLKGAIASICPIQMGGGIQNKIIESQAVGALTIANSLAIKAFENISESGLLVADSIPEWVDTISQAYRNPYEFEINREMGANYAKKYFSWDSYLSVIEKAIERN